MVPKNLAVFASRHARKYKCANLQVVVNDAEMKITKKTIDCRSAQTEGSEYRGKQASTRNSFGFRFDRVLFKSHPGFNGEVRASVIAPGRMLVSVDATAFGQHRGDVADAAFLAFLAKEMKRNPHTIKLLERDLTDRIGELVEDVSVLSDGDLGDEALL